MDHINPMSKLNKVQYAFKISCIFQIFIVSMVIIKGHGSYSEMTKVRESLNFLFELRMIPLLLLTYLFQYIKKDNYKTFRTELALFTFLTVLFCFVQARSLLVEVGCILGYYFCKKHSNKVKLKYIIILYIISILPNIMVLGRLSPDQYDLCTIDTWKNIFTYEYTILFNSILGEVIYSTEHYLCGETLVYSLNYMIPSFIRDVLDITPNKDTISTVAYNAGVFGGGFSLFAELYLNFGWFSLILFFLIGCWLGNLDNKWFYYKKIPFKYMITPFIYSYIILGLRNDIAVTIKQIVQIYIMVYILNLILNIKQNAFTSR